MRVRHTLQVWCSLWTGAWTRERPFGPGKGCVYGLLALPGLKMSGLGVLSLLGPPFSDLNSSRAYQEAPLLSSQNVLLSKAWTS